MSAQVSTRPQAERPPAERALLVLLATVLIAGGLWLWGVLTAPAAAVPLVTWGGGGAAAIVCACVTIAAYSAGVARRSRSHASRTGTDLSTLEQDMYRLADATLPAVVKRLRDGAAVEAVLAEVPPPASSALQRVLHTVTREIGEGERRSSAALAARASVEGEAIRLADETLPALVNRMREGVLPETALAGLVPPANGALRRLFQLSAQEIGEGERRGAAAMAASASAAARVQAQTTRMLAELRELENRYSEEKVFAELLDLDHRISQLGRLADSVALLSGGRSGRRWTKPIVMESILRGAMGRVDAYRRIVLHSASTVAVVGYAAEGVMHALAELLDNAATFSAHGTQVHVYVEEEDAGVLITIEDSGLGMRKRERHRAETLVSGPLDLTTLSGTRLGLAVVGRLASKYGLTVSFRPSSRGGTGVLVMIPQRLITQPRQDAGAAPSPIPVQVPAQVPALDGDGEADGGLPKRRRGETLAAAGRPTATPPAPPARETAAPGARFAAFRQAGHASSQPSPQHRTEQETQ